jgi:hypothetical protein
MMTHGRCVEWSRLDVIEFGEIRSAELRVLVVSHARVLDA